MICGVVRNTVSSWIDNWEQLGLDGLSDKDRPGGPPKLNAEENQLLLDLAFEDKVFFQKLYPRRETPRSVANMITELFEKTGKLISDSTVKRLLRKAGLKWKRVRKIMKKKPDADEFETARNEIDELKEQHKNGELELWFFDEVGNEDKVFLKKKLYPRFDLEPKVPYAWQPIGETIEVPCSKSSRLNVFEAKVFFKKTFASKGFLTPDNQFEPFVFECNIDTDIVIATFDQFAKTITKKRVIIIDNAPIHTSHKFVDKIKEWEEKGLFIKFLPTYSPQLNIIEILWRFIKYEWLPFSAYTSFKQLVIEVENILIQIGERFKINFAN